MAGRELPQSIQSPLQVTSSRLQTDLSYHFIPADSAKTAKLAIITKYLWFDAYAEVLGPEFMKLNAPRILVAIGTPGYTRQRTEVVGSADGGYKVILGKVNSLTDQALADYETMTTYYFHTMSPRVHPHSQSEEALQHGLQPDYESRLRG